jgi:parallel beta-helix repeat protein
VIINNVIDQSGADGINITSGGRNTIRDNRITNSSDNLVGHDGIKITSTNSVACNDNVVDGNTATDTQATKTQRYGLYIASSLCARTVVGANSFSGNLTGTIRDVGTGTIYTTDNQAPTTPTGLSASAVSATRIDLAWNASSDNVGVSGYTIYRDGSKIDTVGGGTRAYSDTTVQPSTSYSYQVDAFDAAGQHSAKSTAANETTPSGTGGGITARIVADTYVASDLPSSNFGTSTALRLDNSPVRTAYLRFDVQGLSGAPSQVVLRIYATSASTTGHQARAVGSNTWSETGITWDSAPAFGSVISQSGGFAAASWVDVDVTGSVTGDGLHSFAITTTSGTAIGYASRESANDPQLVITP